MRITVERSRNPHQGWWQWDVKIVGGETAMLELAIDGDVKLVDVIVAAVAAAKWKNP